MLRLRTHIGREYDSRSTEHGTHLLPLNFKDRGELRGHLKVHGLSILSKMKKEAPGDGNGRAALRKLFFFCHLPLHEDEATDEDAEQASTKSMAHYTSLMMSDELQKEVGVSLTSSINIICCTCTSGIITYLNFPVSFCHHVDPGQCRREARAVISSLHRGKDAVPGAGGG